MKQFQNIINESLLDDVEVDEVVDELNVEYKFIFYFKSDRNPKMAMNTFFGSAMEPALRMMKSNGLMDSWDFDMSFRSAVDFPVIGLFMDCMYNDSASLSENNSFVLSFVVRFPEVEESAEFLGTVSAILMQYAFATGMIVFRSSSFGAWRDSARLIIRFSSLSFLIPGTIPHVETVMFLSLILCPSRSESMRMNLTRLS